jgi:hypothetical protein
MIDRLSTWTLLILAPEAVEVDSLRQFWLVWQLGGATGPLGAVGPPLSCGMNLLRLVTLRIALE